jgi:hypothetical protein
MAFCGNERAKTSAAVSGRWPSADMLAGLWLLAGGAQKVSSGSLGVGDVGTRNVCEMGACGGISLATMRLRCGRAPLPFARRWLYVQQPKAPQTCPSVTTGEPRSQLVLTCAT